MTSPHASSCALHNAPTSEPGPCDCGATDILERLFDASTSLNEVEAEEQLMRSTLLNCFSDKVSGFHVSKEHYRYLAEQVVALRQHLKRQPNTECAITIKWYRKLSNNLLFALVRAIEVAGEAQQEWDKAPNGMRAGKILIALAGGCKGYRADTDQIHETLAVAVSQMKDQPPIAKSEASP